MPASFAVSLGAYTGRGTPTETRIPESFGPPQSMHGFEDVYQNIIDYIVRITYRIWEDRDIEYIADTYSDDAQVFDDYGLQRGSRKIIADTHHTTAAFSNIQLLADEVIWAGDDEVGFHTSHRTLIRGTNDGDSRYGPASNRSVDVLVIANCVARENKIFLEHVLYNNSSLLQQLGHKLHDSVPQLVENAPAGWPRDAATWQALRSAVRPATPISIAQPIAGFDVDTFVRSTLDRLWNHGDFELLSTRYRSAFSWAGPTDRKFSDPMLYRTFIEDMRRSFPDMQVQTDEVYWLGDDVQGYLVSQRWSADATHAGPGLFGAATGKAVQIWGITQYEITHEKIVSEWMLFNELDLMMQIAAAGR